MTKEEAAEEILRGPFTACTRCDGDGTILNYPGSLRGGVCKSCQGRGKWRRGDYVQACIELNMEPQELPPPRFGALLSPDYKEVFRKMLGETSLVQFKKEYAGTWVMAPENTSDTVDALLYGTKHFKP